MNAPDSSSPLDLRLLPSWLKEENSAPDYSAYQGGDERPRRDFPDRGGQRPGGGGGRPGPGGRPAPRRNDGPGGRDSQRGPRPGGGRPGDRPQRQGERPARPGDRPQRQGAPRQEQERRPEPPVATVHFLPEEIALGKVTAQMQGSAAAYPVFHVARMFLQRPERHHVRIVADKGQPLFQLAAANALSSDRARLEAEAFQITRDQFFKVETVETGEIKGNFTSVARCRLNGKVFPPTNHHTFQSAIRREYDERFSRRMSFPEFRSSIETVSDPALVEQWKQEATRTEKYVTLQAEPEQTFATEAEALLYFKKEILPGLISEVQEINMPGVEAAEIRDHRIANTLLAAWNAEVKFPIGMVNAVREHLQTTGLHIFKYKKRILLVSSIRPVWLETRGQNLSESILAILNGVKEKPGIARKDLITGLVGPVPAEGELAPEDLARKNTLIGDLYWLVRQGNVIEFADGTLDLPLSPKEVRETKDTGEERRAGGEVAGAADAAPASVEPPGDGAVAVEE